MLYQKYNYKYIYIYITIIKYDHILHRPFLTFHSFKRTWREARDVEQTVLDLVRLGPCGGLGVHQCEPWVKGTDLIVISDG